jgi:hypothetical protein
MLASAAQWRRICSGNSRTRIGFSRQSAKPAASSQSVPPSTGGELSATAVHKRVKAVILYLAESD